MFVLEDQLETKRRNKPVYFQGISGIGPKYTEELGEAAKFSDSLEAMQSPAYSHSMCFFEPKEIKGKGETK